MENCAHSSERGAREIAIFWDYENVPLPPWCNPAKATKCINNAVSKYGRIVDRRLFCDSEKRIHGPRDVSGLDLSGFDVVNAPPGNSKRMVVDILTFMFDCSMRKIKPCVVLLTSDGEYAYALAKLRDRGVMNMVMLGKECSASQILVDVADVAVSFEKDVLKCAAEDPAMSKPAENITTANATSNVFIKNLPRPTEVKDLVKFLEQHALVEYALIKYGPAGPDVDWCYAHVGFVNKQDREKIICMSDGYSLIYQGRLLMASIDTKAPSFAAIYATDPERRYLRASLTLPSALGSVTPAGIISTLCISLCKVQKSQSKTQSMPFQQCWIPSIVFGQSFQSSVHSELSKHDRKGLYETACDEAVRQGYIQASRCGLGSKQLHVIISKSSWLSNQGVRDDLSRDFYLRLTAEGRSFAQQAPPDQKNLDVKGAASTKQRVASCEGSHSKWICLKNLPRCTHIFDLVQFLDKDIDCPIKRAFISYSKAYPNADWCYAHVEFSSVEGAAQVVEMSTNDKDGLIFSGRAIQALDIGKIPVSKSFAKGDPSIFYDKKKKASPSGIGSLSNSPCGNSNVSPNIAAFCSSVFKDQQSCAGKDDIPPERCWARCSVAADSFQQAKLRENNEKDLSKEDCKVLCRAVRDQAILEGYVEAGRRKLDHQTKTIICVPWFAKQGLQDGLSLESYLRLTGKGLLLHRSPLATNLEAGSAALGNTGMDPELDENDAGECSRDESGHKSTTLPCGDNIMSPEILSFCNHIYKDQHSCAGGGADRPERCWASYCVVSLHFQQAKTSSDHHGLISKDNCKKLCRDACDQAILEGYVEAGRCKLSESEEKIIVPVPWFDNQGLGDGLSTEYYLRLTKKGWLYLSAAKAGSFSVASTNTVVDEYGASTCSKEASGGNVTGENITGEETQCTYRCNDGSSTQDLLREGCTVVAGMESELPTMTKGLVGKDASIHQYIKNEEFEIEMGHECQAHACASNLEEIQGNAGPSLNAHQAVSTNEGHSISEINSVLKKGADEKNNLGLENSASLVSQKADNPMQQSKIPLEQNAPTHLYASQLGGVDTNNYVF